MGCCWLLCSLQHAEARCTHRYACSSVLSELESMRALGLHLLPPSPPAFTRAANRCEAATQDRPESFYIFKIRSGRHTVCVLLLAAHACASLHACARRYMRSRPGDSCMPRRLSMRWTLKAVHIELWALVHDHSALHIDQWNQASDCNGLREAARAALGLPCGPGSMCDDRFRVGVNINDRAVNSDPTTLNDASRHCI